MKGEFMGNFSIRLSSLLTGFLVFITVANFVFLFKYNTPKDNDYIQTMTVAQLKKELDCMTINIYREAGYEPIEGRIAVAQVTMNRVEHPDFPKSVCGVVYQKSAVMSKVVCQFSWYCDSAHRNRPVNQKAYDESYEVAKKVMIEGFRLDGLKDALYYHADYVNPRWRLERIGKIGTHIFYKEKGGDHAKLAGI
jgi:spore germination cell wall hydrolase CwlJ-like protein